MLVGVGLVGFGASGSVSEYEALRSEPNRFAVRPGHVFPEVERIVSENDRFAVVEKVRLAGEVAAAHNPRA